MTVFDADQEKTSRGLIFPRASPISTLRFGSGGGFLVEWPTNPIRTLARFAISACTIYFIRNQNWPKPDNLRMQAIWMQNPLKLIWGEFLSPLLQRPSRLQVAALCYRNGASGREVLMITSRDSGRWIIPKGWPMRGKDSSEAALVEAWEEAGVRSGQTEDRALGHFSYKKRKRAGWPQPVKALVYPIEVQELSDQFPEAAERKRKWVSPDEAANLVSEPELKKILKDF